MSSSTILYNPNSKQLSLPSDITDIPQENETLIINCEQINKLSTSLISESNPNFTPQPKEEASKLIKNLFETGLKQMKSNKLQEALKSISLAIEMQRRKRTPYEAFGIQLQELQLMLRQKIDLELLTGKYLDAVQDLEFLLGTGMLAPEVFIRLTDALLKLNQVHQAKVYCERGLSFAPNETKLKALNMECTRKIKEYNGDI
ncbi:Sec63 complex subunit SEC72 NDAI_0I01830 [Naumovozyma dairenensis CBS 421]|uniref:Uncharacterized protein n=1 Tax=Naumovozyma dairenensis (strain ATCC 10597 / BCRC 20456 / CBS 421 / NBRC 0211 / NRRL Y-12639) TaxID=1071378 RepID=G0WG41_NAUDC|nr:hypothetical protein NDAI_0I01830 [Naumovozyma dairenensis CBS 421]CCD26752.1 hypothetical protein NDAI_0I01830 [Naumovozyma dairenensis CBS 421]